MNLQLDVNSSANNHIAQFRSSILQPKKVAGSGFVSVCKIYIGLDVKVINTKSKG